MTLSKCLVALLLAGEATDLKAQEDIGVSEVSLAPVVQDWDERSRRISQATWIKLRARVTTAGKPDRWVELVHTSSGTGGCLIDGDKPCEPLRQLGLVEVPVDRLLNFLMAQSPSGQQECALPGPPMCWLLPDHEKVASTQATFSEWSFNPEVGMPMPGHIRLQQHNVSVQFEIERFFLRMSSVPVNH